jgi:transcriptional regulator with XRE-family HTH domain
VRDEPSGGPQPESSQPPSPGRVGDLEQRWHELGEFIREQRRVGQMSLRKLAEQAGVSNPYLSQIERGLRRPSAEILQQIARALQISAETLYVQAGILEPRTDQVDVVGEIRRDPDLGEDQKKTLVHIYETFKAEHLGGVGQDGPEVPERAAEPILESDAERVG